MTVREAEFNESDRLVLLASRWDDDRPRGRHGLPMDEATDPTVVGRLEATGAQLDYVQSMVNAAASAHEKQRPKGDTRAYLFGVRPRTNGS